MTGDDPAAAPRKASPETLDALRAEAGKLIGKLPDQLDVSLPLGALGFDSIQTVELQSRAESRFGAVGLVFTPGDDLATLAARVDDAVARDGAGRGALQDSVRTAWSRLRGTPS
jgi:aryl carrier-like protein